MNIKANFRKAFKRKNAPKEVVTVDCEKNPNGGLGVKFKVNNTLQMQVLKAVSVGLAAMTSLVTLAGCGPVDTDNSATDTSETTTTTITEDSKQDDSMVKDAKIAYNNVKDEWEKNNQLAKEAVINAKALIEFTTQEVISYYKNSDTEDYSVRDEYVGVLDKFSDLCDEIIAEAEQGDSDAMQKTLEQAKDLQGYVQENKEIVMSIGGDVNDDGVERIRFEIPSTVAVEGILTAKATTTTLLWGEDMILESSDTNILANTTNPCQLIGVKEGEVTVNVYDNMGTLMFSTRVIVTAKGENNETISSDTYETTVHTDSGDTDNGGGNTVSTKKPVETSIPDVTLPHQSTTPEEKVTKATTKATTKPAETTAPKTSTTPSKTTTATTKATTKPAETTTPKATTKPAETTTPKVTTTVTTTTTPETTTEAPVTTNEYDYYYEYGAGYGNWYGCKNQAEIGYVMSVVDNNWNDYWNWHWTHMDERELNIYANEYFNGDRNKAQIFLTVNRVAEEFSGFSGIKDYSNNWHDDSAYASIAQSNCDCGAAAEIRRLVWNKIGRDAYMAGSDSKNHAWCYVNFDGTWLYQDGVGISFEAPAGDIYTWQD